MLLQSKPVILRIIFLVTLIFIQLPSQGQIQNINIYTIGGPILYDDQESTGFDKLSDLLDSNSDSAMVIFTGNYSGKSSNQADLEAALKPLEKLKNRENLTCIFIPGYDEFDQNMPNGAKKVRLTNSIIRDYLGDNIPVLFDGACPGPLVINVSNKLSIVAINDRWLLQDGEVPMIEEGCPYDRKADLLTEIDQILAQKKDRIVLLAGFTPIMSSGDKGGHFSFRDHIYPLAIDQKGPKIPMPFLGSFYVLYRKSFGNPNDLSNPKTRVYKSYFKEIIQKYPNVVYVAGNERSQEWWQKNGVNQLVSGASTDGQRTIKSNSEFASFSPGFSQINLVDRNTLSVSLLSASNSGTEELFQKIVALQVEANKKVELIERDFSDSVIAKAADPSIAKYEKKRPGLMGLNYRKEWGVNLKNVPYFNWGAEYGGLKIVQKGGGQQTRSLRLENEKEEQYVLRSIKKYPEKAVPVEIRNTAYADIVSDQISASHPYAAFGIPKMAEAANIYHTNPKLVYLANDPRLGEYSEDFAEGLFLFEERPAKDRSDVESFGRSKDIDNTFKVLEKTQKSSEYYVDYPWVVRSRVFDILIGDWDRHDDQWRWARFKTDNDRKIYRPVPRDRDQAFFFSDGILINLASRKWGIPKFQGFEREVRDINGLSFNARYFDRSFTTGASRQDWVNAANYIQEHVTDSIIEASLKEMPAEIYALNGSAIEDKLINRRENLQAYAEDFYEFLSKTVDVVGTNEEDLFVVERLNDDETKVTVYEVSKKKRNIKQKYFERIFYTSETKEIRLYGLKADDEFKISGIVKKGIKIRIIGGGGADKFVDESKVNGWSKKTLVYDKPKRSKLESSGETLNKMSNRDEVNEYDRYAFKYNRLMPFAYVNYNVDDGLFIGGGPHYTTHGFRKEPFKQQHILLANIAPRSANYNLSYNGRFTDVLGTWDLGVKGLVAFPSFSTFFYGLGNATIQSENQIDKDDQYYRVRFDTEKLNTSLIQNSKNDKHEFSIGLNYQRVHIRPELNTDPDDPEFDRFIIHYAPSATSDSNSSSLTDAFRYIGAAMNYTYDSRNNKFLPEKGFYFDIHGSYQRDLNNDKFENVNLRSDGAFYYRLSRRFKAVFAARIGGAANFGEYPFFLAPSIGGLTNLRGFKRNRFTGDQTVFQNTELRIPFTQLKNRYFIGLLGFTLFHDIGRVWADNPTDLNSLNYSQSEIASYRVEDIWHQGYGFGLWLAPFNMAVLSADYAFSNSESRSIFVRLGFLF